MGQNFDRADELGVRATPLHVVYLIVEQTTITHANTRTSSLKLVKP